jgi:hypothetical protein
MSENFHGGSLDVGCGSAAAGAGRYNNDPSNVIELNNLNFFLAGSRGNGGRRSGDAADDFGSLDSSDTTTYLSCCNTHPFPSQGSLAGLEALAAQGSMAANGSINNSVYVNPFDPGRNGGGGGRAVGRRRAQTPPLPPNSKAVMTSTSSTTSPRGSPQRRVRIVAAGARAATRRQLRSRSSDLYGEDEYDDDLDLMDRETGMEEDAGGDGCPPKHRRVRQSQVGSLSL